ncbi:MAG: hypothetical protein ACPLXM_08895 [Bacteroidales bacterium]
MSPRDTLQDMVRKMNFPTDQQGIMNRYLREAHNWQSHLYNARQYIIEFADSLQGKEKLVVFGSGWLLDFPLEELSERFQQITLVDVHHPAQVQHRIQNKFTNVSLLEADITGNGILLSHDFARNYSGKKPDGMFTPDITPVLNILKKEHSSFDTSAVSLNILSQLDAFILDYLRKYCVPEENQIVKLRHTIQSQHIQLLQYFSPSCLITDVTEIRYPRKEDNVVKIPSLAIDLSEGSAIREWTWIFDTTGSYIPGYNVHLDMKAMII